MIDTERTAAQSAAAPPARPLDVQTRNMPSYSNPPSAQPRSRHTGHSLPVKPPPPMQQQVAHPHASIRNQGHRHSRSLSLDVPPNAQLQPAPSTQSPEGPVFLYTLQPMPPSGVNDQAKITAVPFGWMPSTGMPPRPLMPTQRSYPSAPGLHATNFFSPASAGLRNSILPSMPPPPQHIYGLPQPKSRSADHSPATQSPLTLAGPSPKSSVGMLGNTSGSGSTSMETSRSRSNSSSNPVSTSGPAVGGVSSSSSFAELVPLPQPARTGQPKSVPVDLTNPKARRLCEALWELREAENKLFGRCKTCGCDFYSSLHKEVTAYTILGLAGRLLAPLPMRCSIQSVTISKCSTLRMLHILRNKVPRRALKWNDLSQLSTSCPTQRAVYLIRVLLCSFVRQMCIRSLPIR